MPYSKVITSTVQSSNTSCVYESANDIRYTVTLYNIFFYSLLLFSYCILFCIMGDPFILFFIPVYGWYFSIIILFFVLFSVLIIGVRRTSPSDLKLQCWACLIATQYSTVVCSTFYSVGGAGTKVALVELPAICSGSGT